MKKYFLKILGLGFVVFMLFIASKFFYLKVLDNQIFGQNGTSFKSEKAHLSKIPITKGIQAENNLSGSHVEIGDYKFFLPQSEVFQIRYDSSFATVVKSKDTKTLERIIFIQTENSSNESLLLEHFQALDIDCDTCNYFQMMDFIYSHDPKINLLRNSYKTINRSLNLSYLKSLLLVNGGEVNIYRFRGKYLNAFQFCNPTDCEKVILGIYINDEVYTLTFSGFSQVEINSFIGSVDPLARF